MEKELREIVLSIIVPHDPSRSRELLKRCQASIVRAAAGNPFEIIIVSEGNTSQAKNIGAARTIGNVMIFLDDDIEVRPGCFQELLEPFKDPTVGIVGGVNLPFENISLQEKVGAALLASPFTMFKSAARYGPRGGLRETDESEIVGCVMAVRREAFNLAGAFPETIIPCEENVLINRIQALGWKVIYTPFAVVYHRRPRVFREYSRRIFQFGRGRGMMIRRHEGGPRLFWRPNRKWLYYLAGFIVHYVSYIAGVIWGWLTNE
jgi:GT2 family glycosyltransferase